MTVQEEVQLAIDMGIESALEFVLLAKLNLNAPEDGYWGYFNNKRVWLSRVSSGKLCNFNVSYDDRKILDENKFLIKELWDERVDKPYPKKYFTDDVAHVNYELRINADKPVLNSKQVLTLFCKKISNNLNSFIFCFNLV